MCVSILQVARPKTAQGQTGLPEYRDPFNTVCVSRCKAASGLREDSMHSLSNDDGFNQHGRLLWIPR
jgi:hypothetical protein